MPLPNTCSKRGIGRAAGVNAHRLRLRLVKVTEARNSAERALACSTKRNGCITGARPGMLVRYRGAEGAVGVRQGRSWLSLDRWAGARLVC